VAAAYLGSAFALEPSEAALRAWIGALLADGETRAARRAVAKARAHAAAAPALAATLQAIEARLPPQAARRRLSPPPPGQDVRDAFAAEASGRRDEAMAGFERALASSPEPAYFARLGDLALRSGDVVRARRAWARARVLLDERGASLDLVPVETWMTRTAFWAKDDLALLRRFAPLEASLEGSGVLEIWSLKDASAPARRFFLGSDVAMASATSDVTRWIEATGNAVSLRDTTTGTVEARFTVEGERILATTTAGAGADLSILVASERRTELRDARGQLVEAFTLEGTTPTITRVYRVGTHHDNILQDSPSWPASLALGDDKRLVAIGGSDSKVRLVDRRTHVTKLLEYTWKYTEHRHMGGNPDLNLPVAMRFGDADATLTVLYRHGDVIAWSTASGKEVRRVPGPCDSAEAWRVVNRYAGPGNPQRAPTADEMVACGYAGSGAIMPDGRSVISLLEAVRIRALPDGKPRALLVGEIRPSEHIALSPRGDVAFVDLYGKAELLSPSFTLSTFLPAPEETGPLGPALTRNGRFFTFGLGRATAVWDLWASPPSARSPTVDEQVLGVSDEGDRALVQTKDGVHVLDTSGARGPSLGISYGTVHPTFSRGGARVLLLGFLEKGHLVRDVARGTSLVVPVQQPSTASLSADGRRLVSFGYTAPTEVWDIETGKPVKSDPAHARAAVLAPDGSFLVFVEQDDKRPRATATLLPLDGGSSKHIDLEGWIKDVAVSDDGRDVLVMMEQSLVRWTPSDGSRRDVKEDWTSGVEHVRYAAGGRVILFERFRGVELRAAADLARLAVVSALHTGGWVVVSAAGAVDGSADAPDQMLARASAAADTLQLGGRAAWDRFHVPGTYLRALAGEVVAPPVP
jgi:hypothetical protein